MRSRQQLWRIGGRSSNGGPLPKVAPFTTGQIYTIVMHNMGSACNIERRFDCNDRGDESWVVGDYQYAERCYSHGGCSLWLDWTSGTFGATTSLRLSNMTFDGHPAHFPPWFKFWTGYVGSSGVLTEVRAKC